MKSTLLCLAGMLQACCVGSAQPRSDVNFADTASLVSQLRQLQHSLNGQNVAGLRAGLPLAWRVRTPDGDYAISTGPLQGFCDRRSLTDAQIWLDQLATQLEAYNGSARPAPNARRNLQGILARPEFAGNGPPGAWDRFRERISAWIDEMLDRLLRVGRQHPTSGHVVFWLAILSAVGLLAFWLARLWGRDRYELKLVGSPSAIVRSWEQWLRAARAASQEGDIRKAIQCAYWAGVSRLQAVGALPSGVTHTPREYLRMASSHQPGYVPSSAAITPLRTLTSYLERFWYARAAATTDDFSVCLGSLEALGCKLD